MNRLSREVQGILRCPVCRAELCVVDQHFHCTDDGCGTKFPTVNGIPILINQARSIFTISDFLNRKPTFFRSRGRLRGWLSGCIPVLENNLGAEKALAQLRERLLQRSDGAKVLVLGGSIVGAGMEVLLEDPDVEVIESDVSFGPRTQLICDAHDLPFEDRCLDGVVVQAVLEHVVDPVRCVEEIYRVLNDDGLVYADTPFMQQVHGREFDFTRYTRLGHRRLFRRFGELSDGVTVGPGAALAWAARYFVLSFSTNPSLRAILSGLSRLAFFWLKYFDFYLKHKASAFDAAAGFYFLGEKRQEALSDQELVQSYRGGF